ncbi:hypothetical protein [Candidatus Rhabdochlamydia sp. T3358]|uniref:hypothetical protein n=1 Tax=Candidatus Rhabdochlamydia sp. T3358 TaxID=2099795 RepID=UPI0010BABC80|nr:hypothetical protein [Candidatus Rhabdochlamydia sp. T3358]VHO02631.1 hypothetical protein RHT_00567 [Candidatus Rhabdochlamydia sp. T3358]
MIFKTNFFSNMAGPSLLASNPLGMVHPCTTNKVSDFSRGFFSNIFSNLSKIMGFKSFSSRIPKNLMDQFQRSADFYKRFPQLRPTFNDSGSIYNLVKLIKPIAQF